MILWGNEHDSRAKALAAAYGENSMGLAGLARTSTGIVAVSSKDPVLTVWGHGGATSFAELMDVEFGMLVKNWKAKNSGLTTVEIITCDARHNSDSLSGFASRVAKFVHDTYKDIAIKALPVGMHRDDQSILWANTVSSTFCYITSPSAATFQYANDYIKKPGTGNNLNVVAQQLAKERGPAPRDYSVVGGNFSTLRACLGVVQ